MCFAWSGYLSPSLGRTRTGCILPHSPLPPLRTDKTPMKTLPSIVLRTCSLIKTEVRNTNYCKFTLFCFSYQLTGNIFEYMVALWNEHTEAFQHKLMAGAGDPGIAVSSIDNSILSLKGNCLGKK